MNWNIIGGNWKQLKGAVKARWARLTNDHVGEFAAQGNRAGGKAQEIYGDAQEKAADLATHVGKRGKKIMRNRV